MVTGLVVLLLVLVVVVGSFLVWHEFDERRYQAARARRDQRRWDSLMAPLRPTEKQTPRGGSGGNGRGV